MPVAADFAAALAVKDWERLRGLFAAEVSFRGLTPNRSWEAADPEAIVAGVLRRWFEDSDEILELEHLESDSFADRERVGYRFRVRNPEGLFRVEQQAYIGLDGEGRIEWMRTLCSGFRPIEGE